MVNISEVKNTTRESRTAAHTHIKGLGLRSDGYAEDNAAGFVGQNAAREVCSFLCAAYYRYASLQELRLHAIEKMYGADKDSCLSRLAE